MPLSILLVEPDSVVRRFVRRALENGGFGVYEAANVEEAMVGIDAQPDPFGLIIADIFVMNGRKLDAFIPEKSQKAAKSILYLSTMPEAWLHEKGLLNADDQFLLKPFDPTELLTKVREVLSLAGQS